MIFSVLDDDDEGKLDIQQPHIPISSGGIRAKRLSSQYKSYNKLCEFDILEAEDLPLEILRDLESEGCAFCGETDLRCSKSPLEKNCFAVMFCRRLGCRHVVHNACISESTIGLLIPLHSSLWLPMRMRPHDRSK